MIAAVIMAAGRSLRMGRPKLNLPWGETTVIGRVVQVLTAAGVLEIVVVVGGAQAEVEHALAGMPVRLVYNRRYAELEMLFSFQLGLRVLDREVEAALVCLGDQPQIQPQVVADLLAAFDQTGESLIVPSYQMRRGHPWLVGREYWEEILALQPGQSLRDFLNYHQEQIHYMTVESPSVLMDLDTPDDYRTAQPEDPGCE